MKLDYKLHSEPRSLIVEALVLTEQLAKPFESCSLKAYWDCGGYPTNGWGNLLSRVRIQDLIQQKGLTRKQADSWLYETYPEISQDVADNDFRINLNKAFGSVKRLVKIPLSIEQVAALIDFTFNCGGGNLQISTLLRMINRGELYDAANEFPKWNKSSGIIRKGLTKRRLAEQRLFLTGM